MIHGLAEQLDLQVLEWRLRKIATPLGLSIQLSPLKVRRLNRYRPPKGAARHLDPVFFAPTFLPSDDAEQASGSLYDLWRSIPEGHKWHHYFSTYAEVVSRLGKEPVVMLEIGVFRGGSAKMWSRFLPPGSTIVGIDINPDCAKYEDQDSNLFIRIGDQSDTAFLASIVEEFGPFDLILDDGSHRSSHMIASFNHLFLGALCSPGIYLAEDTHAAYWHSFRDQDYSFIDLAKDLVDLIHAHYFDKQSEIFFRKGHSSRAGTIEVPRIASEIDRIDFRDSLIVIYKQAKVRLPISEQL